MVKSTLKHTMFVQSARRAGTLRIGPQAQQRSCCRCQQGRPVKKRPSIVENAHLYNISTERRTYMVESALT